MVTSVNSTNRRALLGALALAPLAALPAVPALAHPAVDRSAWEAAHFAYLDAKSAWERQGKANEGAYRAWSNARGDFDAPIEWIPSWWATTYPNNAPFVFRFKSRADLDRHYKSMLRDDDRRVCEALVDKRDDAKRAVDRQYNIDGIEAEANLHYDAMSAAEKCMVLNTPAPDIAALAVKMEATWADGGDPNEDIVEAILADVRRLAHA